MTEERTAEPDHCRRVSVRPAVERRVVEILRPVLGLRGVIEQGEEDRPHDG